MSTTSSPSDKTDIQDITKSLDAIGEIVQLLHSKKRQILSEHNQTVQSHIQNIKNTVIQLLLPLAQPAAKTPQPTDNVSHAQKTLYSKIHMPSNIKRRPQPTSVVIKTDETTNINKVENSITKLLHEQNIEATMLRCQDTHNGKIRLQFDPKDNVTAIADTITNNLGYEAKGRPLIQPKVTISHIPSHVDLADITNEILESNSWLKECHEDFEVLFTYTHKDFGSAVCKVSAAVRQRILENGGALKIGARACPVKDRFHITQCRNCCRFGHTTSKCRSATPSCLLCAKDHKHSACPHKEAPRKAHLSCANCLSSKSASSSEPSHSAIDRNCPQYKAQLMRLWKITNWGQGPSPIETHQQSKQTPKNQ